MRISLGDSTLTMSTEDAMELARQLGCLAVMLEGGGGGRGEEAVPEPRAQARDISP